MTDVALDRALQPLQARSLLVGLSGGLDSTVLLHALAQARSDRSGLRALHVHHGLLPEADTWSEHCRRLCADLGVEFVLCCVEVERDSGLGLEAAARKARHAAFAAELREGEALVLAHHRDDQAETVLLRLLRGSGSGGLAAMRAERSFGDNTLLRPLLGVDRADLLAYAQAQGLAWCEDPSNADTGPDRNFLRHRVLPLLGERWPQASIALSRSAALLEEDAGLLESEAARRLDTLVQDEETSLDATGLLAMDAAWRARVLRLWLERLGLPPLSADAPALIAQQVLGAEPDRVALYRWSGAELKRWRGCLVASLEDTASDAEISVPWDGAVALEFPRGGLLELLGADHGALHTFDTSVFGECRVGSRIGGERIRLPNRLHHHLLKHLLQEAQVPPWERQRIPLLFAGDGELLAAGDVVISARLQAWCEPRALFLRWKRPAAAGN